MPIDEVDLWVPADLFDAGEEDAGEEDAGEEDAGDDNVEDSNETDDEFAARFLHAVSAADGSFSFSVSAMTRREYEDDQFETVWLHHNGHVQAISFSALNHIADGQALDIDFPFDDQTGTFRITSPEAEPLSGAVVYPVEIANGMPPGLREKLKRIADDDGSVSYPLFTALSIPFLEINSRSHGIQHYPVKNYEQEDNLNVMLKAVGGIEGRVVDSEGQPLAGFEFMVITMTGPDDHNGVAHCVSGIDGGFSVPAIAVGEAVLVDADSRAPWSHLKDSVVVRSGEVVKAEVVVALHSGNPSAQPDEAQPDEAQRGDSQRGNDEPNAEPNAEMEDSDLNDDVPKERQRFVVRGIVTQSGTDEPVADVKMRIQSHINRLMSRTFVSETDGTFAVDQ